MRCDKCGTENPNDAVFCSACGNRLINQSEITEHSSGRVEATQGELDLNATNENTNKVKADKVSSAFKTIRSSVKNSKLKRPKKPIKEYFTKKRLIIYGIAALAIIIALLFSSGTICIHDWQDATCTKPVTCSKCHKTKGEALGHKWEEATCTKAEKCSVCGETKGEPLGHDADEWTTTKEATCTENGVKQGKCKRCKEMVEEEIEALGHDWEEWKTAKKATCTENGVNERACKRCGEKETDDSITALGHDWGDWKTVKKPTYSKEGQKERICKRCKKQEKDSIAKLDISTVKDKMTAEQKNAYQAAKDYLDFSAFSRKGLINQLSSEYGSNYPKKVATFVVDLLETEGAVDWYEQAERAAKEYLDFSSFSKAELIQQLESEYGSQFTHDQAVKGVERAYK